MLWDTDELSERFVKRNVEPVPLHRAETISVFGATDVVNPPPDSAAASATPEKSPVPEGSPLAEHQGRMPRLPIPPLKHTCELYLNSLEGLISAEDYERTEHYVEDFSKPGGVGERLQVKLEEWEATKKHPSWFEPIWDDAYLCARDAVAININYFFGFEDHPKRDTHSTQLGRAASLVRAAAEIYTTIRDGELPLDTERGQPLCMSQYRRVFCASRIPQIGRDKVVTYSTAPLLDHEKLSGTTEYERRNSNHIVVLVRNRFFKLDIIDGNGAVLPMERIVELLACIRHKVDAEDAKAGAPVGIFTTMDRDSWADIRAHLVQLGNEANLVAIQSAIIVLVLDGVDCETQDELARLLLHGPGTNRWFDRHNLIVSHNGRAGLNFEHSVGDGIITLRVADNMFRMDSEQCLDNQEVGRIIDTVNMAERRDASEVQELAFRLDGLLDGRMKGAYNAFTQLISSNETMTMQFDHFGGDFIKRSKVSPDAFVQLAFQLTHYRLFGRLDATYEAASTRGFLHGRTEVVRSVTRAAADFVESAHQPIFARKINSKVPSQIQLLRSAAEAHVSYMRLAKNGYGVDRHLLGLRRMCVMHDIDMPEIFSDPNFARSAHWILSTSHCGSPALTLFGFGPVVNDGFGLGYMIKNTSISCCVTSKYTHRLLSSTIFSTMLESSLMQMRAIVEADWEKRRAQQPTSLAFVHPTSYADFEYRGEAGFVYHRPRRSLYSSVSGNYSDSSAMSPKASSNS